MNRNDSAVLEVVDLEVSFRNDEGIVHAVNGVSFELAAGESLAIVGESGSGKSVTALAIMGLLPASRRMNGHIRFRARELLELDERQLRTIRGREIAMIYQDPMTSLNPTLTVGRQLTQVIRHHLGYGRAAARDHAAELLNTVGIPDARRRLREYPHQFSGGQRQRILIALALACDPAVLIADEPTTALDVTTQAQIIALVQDLRSRLGTAIVWITHDLGVVAGLVDRVMVMYGGIVAEHAPVDRVFAEPRHPYTRGLLGSLPAEQAGATRLQPIPGTTPSLSEPVTACPFAPRCADVQPDCRQDRPPLELVDGHGVACFHPRELAARTRRA